MMLLVVGSGVPVRFRFYDEVVYFQKPKNTEWNSSLEESKEYRNRSTGVKNSIRKVDFEEQANP